MSRNNKKIIGLVSIASLATIGAVFFFSWKKHVKKQKRILDQIADEGYETAHDILYPLKRSPIRRIL
jgi:hypothetical protein